MGVVQPLSAQEFDAIVVSRPDFDRLGLIVAERDGELIGFAHAGFGPTQPAGPPHQLDPVLGTVAMLVVPPTADGEEVGRGLLQRAEGYLVERGARVVYAGGITPLDPFYRAIYGGSEWSGILDGHEAFRRVVVGAGFEVAARSTLLELDLAAPERRDPKAVVLRRMTRLDVAEDVLPESWWDALGLGFGPIHRYRLIAKGGEEVASALTWDMAGFGRGDGRTRVGLRALAVAPSFRRQGFGRFLVAEVARRVRDAWGDVLTAATDQCNIPALALYASLGFEPVAASALYRRPGV